MTTRHLRIVIFVFLCLSASCVFAEFSNRAVRPSDRTGTSWYLQRHNAILSRVSRGRCDLIFIGDSIVQQWETTGKDVWNRYYGDRRAINLGFNGDRTEHVLWRLDHGELEGIYPKVAVILIGSNNSFGGEIGEATAGGIIAVAERVRAKLPETEILILAIFPRGQKPSTMRQEAAQASMIASMIADASNIHYLDIGSSFLGPYGIISTDIMSDYIHPTERGYEIWAQKIEFFISRYLD